MRNESKHSLLKDNTVKRVLREKGGINLFNENLREVSVYFKIRGDFSVI